MPYKEFRILGLYEPYYKTPSREQRTNMFLNLIEVKNDNPNQIYFHENFQNFAKIHINELKSLFQSLTEQRHCFTNQDEFNNRVIYLMISYVAFYKAPCNKGKFKIEELKNKVTKFIDELNQETIIKSN